MADAGWQRRVQLCTKKIQKYTITQATPAVRTLIRLRLCRGPSIREVARPPRSSVALMGENNLTKLVKAEEKQGGLVYWSQWRTNLNGMSWVTLTKHGLIQRHTIYFEGGSQQKMWQVGICERKNKLRKWNCCCFLCAVTKIYRLLSAVIIFKGLQHTECFVLRQSSATSGVAALNRHQTERDFVRLCRSQHRGALSRSSMNTINNQHNLIRFLARFDQQSSVVMPDMVFVLHIFNIWILFNW